MCLLQINTLARVEVFLWKHRKNACLSQSKRTNLLVVYMSTRFYELLMGQIILKWSLVNFIPKFPRPTQITFSLHLAKSLSVCIWFYSQDWLVNDPILYFPKRRSRVFWMWVLKNIFARVWSPYILTRKDISITIYVYVGILST